MKKLLIILVALLVHGNAMACEVCERNKPKILQGVTHGSGPDSNWDYVIVIFIAIIAVLTLFYSVKWLIRPGEKNKDHIKYAFLNED